MTLELHTAGDVARAFPGPLMPCADLGVGLQVETAAYEGWYLVEALQAHTADLWRPEVLASRWFTTADVRAGALAGGVHVWLAFERSPTKPVLGLRLTAGGRRPALTVSAWLTSQTLFSALVPSVPADAAIPEP